MLQCEQPRRIDGRCSGNVSNSSEILQPMKIRHAAILHHPKDVQEPDAYEGNRGWQDKANFVRASPCSAGICLHIVFAPQRGPGQYAMHGSTVGEPIIGRVIGKGLAADEMGDRLHLVIDGVDGRADYVERIDSDRWRIPADIAERSMAHDARNRGSDFSVRILSALDLDRQVSSDGATWLDRELASPNRTSLAHIGFGREVSEAMDRRSRTLVNMGHAVRLDDGRIRASKDFIANLGSTEVTRVGKAMAAERGLTFTTAKTGEYVSGKLVGSTQLASGRFAMIDDGIGFQLVPWQPVLDKRIGQHIAGIMRNAGGIEWGFGRKRGLGL